MGWINPYTVITWLRPVGIGLSKIEPLTSAHWAVAHQYPLGAFWKNVSYRGPETGHCPSSKKYPDYCSLFNPNLLYPLNKRVVPGCEDKVQVYGLNIKKYIYSLRNDFFPVVENPRWRPSFIYSWSISHILEHEFFYLGRYCIIMRFLFFFQSRVGSFF